MSEPTIAGRAFKLTPDQNNKAMEWMGAHDCAIGYAGAIGGKYTFSFTSTSLGHVCKLKCACGKSIDLSEYENW